MYLKNVLYRLTTLYDFFRFSDNVKTISLPTRGKNVYTYGIATGWGDTRLGGKASKTLQEVRVRIWKNFECASRYDQIGDSILDTMLCAGEPGKDTCQVSNLGLIIYNRYFGLFGLRILRKNTRFL